MPMSEYNLDMARASTTLDVFNAVAEAKRHRRSARRHVRGPARTARSRERDAARADADEARSLARRPLVPRPRRQHGPSLGPRAGHQAAEDPRNLGPPLHVVRGGIAC